MNSLHDNCSSINYREKSIQLHVHDDTMQNSEYKAVCAEQNDRGPSRVYRMSRENQNHAMNISGIDARLIGFVALSMRFVTVL